MAKEYLPRLQQGANLIRQKCLHEIWWLFADMDEIKASKYVSDEFKKWCELENFYVKLLREYALDMEKKGLALTGHPLAAFLKSREDGINAIAEFKSIELDGSGICFEININENKVMLSDRYLMEKLIKDGVDAITTFELDSIVEGLKNDKYDVASVLKEIQKINKVFYGVAIEIKNE